MRMLASEIATVVDATLYGRGDVVVCEAVNDHRQMPAQGGLFLALRGSRTDGHDYLSGAATAGAAAALVTRTRVDEFLALSTTMTLLAVDNVEGALWALALNRRQAFSGPVVAITGSVGKTTTKTMVGLLLGHHLGSGCMTRGNQNNLLGAPMTLVRLNPEDRFLVVELGSNAPGEIPRLAELAQPSIAVVTAVGAAHLEGFGTLAGVLKEKASLARAVGPDGVAVFSSRRELLVDDATAWSARVLSYGGRPEDDVRVTAAHSGGLAAGTLVVDGVAHALTLPVPGAFNLDNAGAAILVARELGLPVARAVELLRDFVPESMRMEWRRQGGFNFLVDAYNANPESVGAVLETLAQMSGARRIAILGSMLELGKDAASWHGKIGALAAALALDHVIFVGEFAPDYLAGARSVAEDGRCAAVADHAAAAQLLRSLDAQGAFVLLKGSRGSRMEKILDCMVEEA